MNIPDHIKQHDVYVGKFFTYICHKCHEQWRMELSLYKTIPTQYQEIFCPYCGSKGLVQITGCVGICCEDDFAMCPKREELAKIYEKKRDK